LKLVQHFGVGKVFGQKTLQLQTPESLQISGQVQANHFSIKASGQGQQAFELLSVRVLVVEQACGGLVQHAHDVRDGHGFQMQTAGLLHTLCQRSHLGGAELRQLDPQG